MSVQWIPLRVTRTQIVPTAKGLIAVHVNKDLLEMGQFVKVNQASCHKRQKLFFADLNLLFLLITAAKKLSL